MKCVGRAILFAIVEFVLIKRGTDLNLGHDSWYDVSLILCSSGFCLHGRMAVRYLLSVSGVVSECGN